MAGKVEAAFDVTDTVDMIVVMTNHKGAELGAVFNRDSLHAQARSASHVRRYAVVGGPLWAKAMINLLSPLAPVEARTFDLEDQARAWRWVGSPRRPTLA
jgi:hypothetical protein